MDSSVTLTLILPVHNGGSYIVANLAKIISQLEVIRDSFEVLVVSDGSTDQTVELARTVKDSRVRVMHYPDNRGKGFAICFGFAEAHGQLVGWLDSDLDVDPYSIVAAVQILEQGEVDAVIGSKRHPESQVDYPRVRRLYSWSFQILVRLLVRVRVRDTQVGAKVFRREMLDVVVPLLLIKRYAFDLELLAVGVGFGFDRIEEMPIRLNYRFTGTGIDRRAVWRMFLDVLAITYRIHLRHWYARQFAVLQRKRTDIITDPGSSSISQVTTYAEITSNRI